MFGMSMMSMKPLFPEKVRGGGYRAGRAANHGVALLYRGGNLGDQKRHQWCEKHTGMRLITWSLGAEKSLPPLCLAGWDRFSFTPL